MDISKLTLDDIRNITKNREAQFENVIEILNNRKSKRTVLFELFLNETLHKEINGTTPKNDSFIEKSLWVMQAFRSLGYDYFSLNSPPDFFFPRHEHANGDSISQNDLSLIHGRKDFSTYPWPQLSEVDFSYLDQLNNEMLPGMKALPLGPNGVLENTTEILGFDNMCYLYYDDPQLLGDVFNRVGETLLAYYKILVDYDCIGAVIVNDDWGFATQTMLSPQGMQKYVIPWHKKIAQLIHEKGKKTILHSCGQLESVMDDVIDNIGHDGKHSYEDKILPVEKAYEKWGKRIAVFGGIDMDFLCRSTPDQVYRRAKLLIEQTGNRAYALGTGNSVPEYIPRENYLAMILAGLE